ncbi:MAG: adenylate/guanylate cyclase domain-containing protein [Alphaproteobacteria bacterium]|nr:adenylate/guanylate cyclase domain-containing protein [Alphaproteobacteria bacterium]
MANDMGEVSGEVDRVLQLAMHEIIDWLAGDECYALDGAGLAAELGRRLNASGLPLDHLGLYLRTLHPEIVGYTIGWAPNEAPQVFNREYGIEHKPFFAGNPIHHVLQTRKPAVVRIDYKNHAWAHIDILEGRHLVELVVLPLHNTGASPSAVSFATAREAGFSPAERAALERIAPALRNICELRTLRHAEHALLGAYVGTLTARHVLEGHVRRGEVETLEAALMVCDLRGFTEMSNRLPCDRVLQHLNAYFQCVVPPIGDAGGEVIKFMGDGVLAFFQDDNAATACAAALRAGVTALERLEARVASDAPLRAGIALHYGEMSYGNIGYGHRLDFTLIGPDVNLVSRLQGICSKTGRPLLMSERFARLLDPMPVVALGGYKLKGFTEPAEVYAVDGPGGSN